LVHVQAAQGIDLAVLQWQVFGMFDGERILSPAIQLALIKFSPAKLTELSPG
jgi:cellobiose-specific phosphotransferase system component IIB